MPTYPSAEHARLAETPAGLPGDWKVLGPYLSERAWGTVREDYSADGQAWDYFPHDNARSRAYRWNEDGLAGICDINQRLCLALAFWNGRDPFLKERIFSLSNSEGNHGEDAKEHWWYLDATPTASWLRWRYHYPQAAFPYARLREENAGRTREESEFELLDTGIFDDNRYWQITADYAKAAPRNLCLRLRVRNAGPEPDELHVLPTLWFRNRWSWEEGSSRPLIRAATADANGPAGALIEEALLGRWRFVAGSDPEGRPPELLFCENETNTRRLFHSEAQTPYPKDGINDHVVSGAPTVNPGLTGTKMACRYRIRAGSGETVELRLRLALDESGVLPDLGADFTVELPTGSGEQANLDAVADELECRLLRLFLPDAHGRRPADGDNPHFRNDPAWRDQLQFHEYFHGDTGEGLGASHQTGWTALVAALLAGRDGSSKTR